MDVLKDLIGLWRSSRLAIFLIALCAQFTLVNAQNGLKNLPESGSATTSFAQQEQVQRERIAQERAAQERAYEQERQACYQKLAVNDCLTQARDAYNEKMRDLKRQEVALNDEQRKRNAAERLRLLDEKNSPEAQLKAAQRRGLAMKEAQEREARARERQQARSDSKPAAAPQTAKPMPPLSEPAGTKPSPAAEATVLPQEKAPAAPKTAKPAANAASNPASANEREKKLQERRQKAAQREKQRTKPPAASLPIPPS